MDDMNAGDMHSVIPGREHIEIQTDQFVEDFTDKPPKYEIGVMTEIIEVEEAPQYLMPQKEGVDFCA